MCLCAYLIGLCIIRTLCILSLFDVLYHLPKKGMTVVLVLGHQHFQHEPQAPARINTNTMNSMSQLQSSPLVCLDFLKDFSAVSSDSGIVSDTKYSTTLTL